MAVLKSEGISVLGGPEKRREENMNGS